MDDFADPKDFSTTKICPKCGKKTLVFDEKNTRIYCTSCGYEEPFLK